MYVYIHVCTLQYMYVYEASYMYMYILCSTELPGTENEKVCTHKKLNHHHVTQRVI